jgi:hypothetical protein
MAILLRHIDIAGVAGSLRRIDVGWALLAVALSGLWLSRIDVIAPSLAPNTPGPLG